jgi:4-carboxymuconolactone decarboxylase
MSSRAATSRLAPLEGPYEPVLARTLERMMPPGVEPLRLFRTVAHNRHILEKLRSTGAYLLNFGAVDPADREIVIHRTCALCGCEYEWGVHVLAFGRPLGLSEKQISATVLGDDRDPAWSERQALLVALADELHDTATISDELWRALRGHYSEAQLIELIALVGQYHLVSYLANGLGVRCEEGAARFPATSPPSPAPRAPLR